MKIKRYSLIFLSTKKHNRSYKYGYTSKWTVMMNYVKIFLCLNS